MGGLCFEIWAPPKMRTVKLATMTKSRMARVRWLT
jgi:hypothetical protein